jgi:hypothetical protein
MSFVVVFSQEQEVDKITVKKESNLVKAFFDSNELKLIAQDKYGNIDHHAIRSFEMHYEVKKKKLKVMKSSSMFLTLDMLHDLSTLKEAKKIFYTKIIAEDQNGILINLPDLVEIHFPKCKQNLK